MNRRSQQLAILRTVAAGLGPFLNKVVFVGGAIADFLITDPGSADARYTDDIDVVIESATYAHYSQVQDEIRKLGFVHEMDGPVCRFKFGEILVDIMPTEESVLGFRNQWYAYAYKNAIQVPVSPELTIQILDAPTFLCTKIDAFLDRGNSDYQMSADVEDIVAVIDGRIEIFEDLYRADSEIKAYLHSKFSQFLRTREFIDALPGLVSVRAENRHDLLKNKITLLLRFALTSQIALPDSLYWLTCFSKLIEKSVFNLPARLKTAPFSLDQHYVLAPIISELVSRVIDIDLVISTIYPRMSPVQRKGQRVRKLIGALQSQLDNEFCKLPVKTPPFPYYEGVKQKPPKLAQFIDQEIEVMVDFLIALRELSSYYYSTEARVIEAYDQLVQALQDLHKTLLIGYRPKKRHIAELASCFGPNVTVAVAAQKNIEQLVAAQGKKGDFLDHECDFCRPLGEDSGHVILPAYSDLQPFRSGGYQLYVWCRYCWCFHLHGGGDDPLNGTGDGSRVPHCSKRDELGCYNRDYILKCVGYLTPEIEQLHEARESVRDQYVRARKKDNELRESRGREKAFIKNDQIVCGLCFEEMAEKAGWMQSELKSQRSAYFAICSFCRKSTNVSKKEFNAIVRPGLF